MTAAITNKLKDTSKKCDRILITNRTNRVKDSDKIFVVDPENKTTNNAIRIKKA